MEGYSLLISIIALLKQFLGSPSNKDLQDFEAFTEFLLDHNHKQVIEGLDSNQLLSLKIQELLKKNLASITASLDEIAKNLAELTSKSPDLAELTHAACAPGTDLPPANQQQIEILIKMYVEGDGSLIILSQALGETKRLVIGGSSNLIASDPSFLEDDLASLTEAGLLISELNRQGNPIWKGTRKGQAIAKQINQPDA